jgi:uncharacterized SAM-binding protein YcdF (DUF218 family)
MFFYVAKIGWFFAQPSVALAALLCLGALLLFTRLAWLGAPIVLGCAALLLIVGLSPLGNAVILPLEDRFPRTELDDGESPAGIVVLGGAEDVLVGRARNTSSLNEAADRIVEAVALARRFPDAPILFTGGEAGIVREAGNEAVGASRIFERLGVPPDRLLLEDKARDTYENAVLSGRIMSASGREGRWLLVTSAYHMPRAMGCFRKAGVTVYPWPVDYRTRGPQDLTRGFDKVSEGLRRMDIATREWMGLLFYRLTDRIADVFPAP